jgi:hypothetical protein
MYKFDTHGRLFDADGLEVPQDDRDARYLAYVAWLSEGRAPELIEGTPAPDPVAELESAEAWGRALVRQVEIDLLESGINDDRRRALAIDRELAEVGAKLKDGRLHIALAALEELLEKPEQERYSADAMLKPIEALIRERLKLEEAASR